MSVNPQTVSPVQTQRVSFRSISNSVAKSIGKKLLKTIVYIFGFCVLWEVIYLLMVQVLQIWVAVLFPSPFDVIGSFGDHWSDGSLLAAISSSMLRLLVGFGISLPLGVALGLGLSRSHLIRTVVGPLVVGMQALPSICWLPLAILWFGLNESSIIFVVVMGSIFSITAATYDGTKLISPLLLKAATNMGVRGWRLFLRVVMPAALPAIISGTRQGWSFAWRSLMAGELLTAGVGLGNLLEQGRDVTDMPLVIVVMIVIVALGLIIDQLVLTNLENAVRARYGLVSQLS